ncbi:GNAT family N-acetyltransferase [Petrachloros mirabilis]
MPSRTDIVVRVAGEADVEEIVAFSAAMALETEGRQLDVTTLRAGTLSLLATPEHGFFMVAEALRAKSRQLVGQTMITYEWSDWRNGMFWWVQSVYVHPDWRRQGVYRRMYETILTRAKSRPGVCGIRLYVEQENHKAQTVYQRVGLAPSAYIVYEKDFIFTDTVPTQKPT